MAASTKTPPRLSGVHATFSLFEDAELGLRGAD